MQPLPNNQTSKIGYKFAVRAIVFKKYGTTGHPVIILHGLFGMSDNWHNIARNLSITNIVYNLDLRNHGQSPHSSVMNFGVMADDVWEFMKNEGLQSAILIGHSMGGKVAMMFCNKYPEKADKLIVVDISPKAYKPGHKKYFDAMKAIDFNVTGRKDIEEQLAKTITDKGEMLFLLKNLYREEDGSFGLKLNLEAIENNYDEIIKEVGFNKMVSVPTYFIRGENSRYIDLQDEIDLKKYFTNVRFYSIPDSGHWVHADNPVVFLEVLLKIIKPD